MSKPTAGRIRLLAGFGVEGDAHAGERVKHRSRVARDPTTPNLRQVHLIPAETHDELRGQGFDISAGQMGENITTRGIDLFNLPTGAKLRLGADAVVEVTGLRTPCAQLDGIQGGLMSACLKRGDDGEMVRRAGVMSVVLSGGDVGAGDTITIELPDGPHQPLEAV